jgi:hypothetical protein
MSVGAVAMNVSTIVVAANAQLLRRLKRAGSRWSPNAKPLRFSERLGTTSGLGPRSELGVFIDFLIGGLLLA